MALQHRARVSAPPVGARPEGTSFRTAAAWLIGGAATTFAVSFVAGDLVGVHHDLYLLIYATGVLGYLGWFAARSHVPWLTVLRRNLWWSLAIGAAVGFAVVRQLAGQVGTDHPAGAYFLFELVWRGLVYGAVDAIVLAVFPALLAYLVMHGNRNGLRRKTAFAGLVVVFSLAITAAYHAGYPTYRSSDMAKPLIGSVMWDVPAMLTGNPAGAVLAHSAVHASAVVHQYYGGENHYLPPELSADYPERGTGTPGQLIAAGWLVLVGLAGLAGVSARRRSTEDRTPSEPRSR